ncbi:helix-turn-helix transcriptional regulator [Alkalihalobacterium bogoriense]|uniref:helix-turn-helix transcriptional regulator n=1 Tax=Alkalihalobacterium bogoriense TaxID=246272 RepID=UPI00047B9FEA|nr:helix-turn-helix transcriptional regulator [Alkalihalobacterium bogoriense]
MFGQKIYYFRKLKGLTQEQLAQGICSISHLSKIENGHEAPSHHMLEHLCKRLGVSLSDIDSTENESCFNEQLDLWYNRLCDRDKQEATRLYRVLEKQVGQFQNPTILVKHTLFTFRYKLLMQDLDEASTLLCNLTKVKGKLEPHLQYYYYLFSGLFSFKKADYLAALQDYQQAEKIHNDLRIQDPEVYYHLSLVNMHLHRTYYSVKYAQLALSSFIQECNYARSIDCQNLLGVNETRVQNYTQAEKHLYDGLRVANLIHDNIQIGVTYHNLGYLFYSQGDYQKAMQYYTTSMNYYHEEDAIQNVRTYYRLARTCFMSGDYPKTLKWIEDGHHLAEKLKKIEFVHHFQVMKHQVQKDNPLLFEAMLKEEVIPYFEEKQIWYYVARYAEMLAEYYANDFKYKNSTYYYSLVNESRKKIYKYTV